MPTPTTNEPASELQNILVNSNTAVKFLDELSKLAAEAVSETAGDEVECAVTVKVRRRPATAAGSSNRAIELDQMEQKIGDGPCITALRQTAPVSMEDVGSDPRWPELAQRFVVAGVHSSVAIPLNIGAEAAGALNLATATANYAMSPPTSSKTSPAAASKPTSIPDLHHAEPKAPGAPDGRPPARCPSGTAPNLWQCLTAAKSFLVSRQSAAAKASSSPGRWRQRAWNAKLVSLPARRSPLPEEMDVGLGCGRQQTAHGWFAPAQPNPAPGTAFGDLFPEPDFDTTPFAYQRCARPRIMDTFCESPHPEPAFHYTLKG